MFKLDFPLKYLEINRVVSEFSAYTSTKITFIILNQMLPGGMTSPSSKSEFHGLSRGSEAKPLRRLCGWRLANKLYQVCKGIYNKPASTANELFYRSLRDQQQYAFQTHSKEPRNLDEEQRLGTTYKKLRFSGRKLEQNGKTEGTESSPADSKNQKGSVDSLSNAEPTEGHTRGTVYENFSPAEKIQFDNSPTVPANQKRFGDTFINEALRHSILSEGGHLPFFTYYDASRMFKGQSRYKRGLSAECCRKTCQISELMGYCQ
ncbi:hypothetical protein SK128_005562 [Halocaridina rubra]|uniref:Insulin-like domain-containing protein n=1 Tax=Halocaridina rubra TaxID=373956 RepID=A0AAN9AAV6_HALRR